MRATMIGWRLAAVAGFLVAAPPTRLEAQGQNDWRAAAIHAVIDFRVTFLGDTVTKFDACRSSAKLGEAGAHIRALLEEAKSPMLLANCEAAPPPSSRAVFLVDSIAAREGGAWVRLSVAHGEYLHMEDYTIRGGRGAGLPSVVVEVRTWGLRQVYPVRPSPTPE